MLVHVDRTLQYKMTAQDQVTRMSHLAAVWACAKECMEALPRRRDRSQPLIIKVEKIILSEHHSSLQEYYHHPKPWIQIPGASTS
jgi:hypothetical protein